MKYVYKTKKDFAYESIREEIVSGRLSPGTKLNIQNYADKFGMSPIPVREALSQLYYEGLIHSVPCVGSVVAELDIDKAFEITAMRYSIERIAFRDALRQMTEEDLLSLEKMMSELKKYYEHGEIKSFVVKNHEFYTKMYSYSVLKNFKEEIDNLYMTSRVNSSILNPSRIPGVIEEQEKLLDAIRNGRLEEAEKVHLNMKINATISIIDAMENLIKNPDENVDSSVATFFVGKDIVKDKEALLSQMQRNREIFKNILK